MAVVSLRLNKSEESMVNFLSGYYEQDRSSLIKYSLRELYEDIIDNRTVTEYEAKREKGEAAFVDSGQIIAMLEKHG